MILPTDDQILEKQSSLIQKGFYIYTESFDSVRIAYAWLDAQIKLKTVNKKHTRPLKHIIESWGGRYVSADDVIVAAMLHPNIKGKYPHFNISSKLISPDTSRLKDISEAGLHPNYRKRAVTFYTNVETL